MKNKKALKSAFAFLIDSFFIYFITSILATFINPYANSYQNIGIFALIYTITIIVYIWFFVTRYGKTPGQKIFKS